MHLLHSLEKFTYKATKNLVFLIHRHLIQTVSNAGSAKTNAGYPMAGAAIVVSGEIEMDA